MYADNVFCMTEQAGKTTEETGRKEVKYVRNARTCKFVGYGDKKKLSFTILSFKASSLKIFIFKIYLN